MGKEPTLLKLLLQRSNFKAQDLHDLFDWLDHDGGGTITIDEFMRGFRWIHAPLSSTSLARLRVRLTSGLLQLGDDVIETIQQKFEQVRDVARPIANVHAVSEHMVSVDDSCGGMQQGLKKSVEGLATRQDLID